MGIFNQNIVELSFTVLPRLKEVLFKKQLWFPYDCLSSSFFHYLVSEQNRETGSVFIWFTTSCLIPNVCCDLTSNFCYKIPFFIVFFARLSVRALRLCLFFFGSSVPFKLYSRPKSSFDCSQLGFKIFTKSSPNKRRVTIDNKS